MKPTATYIGTALKALLIAVLLLAGCVERELETRPSQTDGDTEIVLDWGGLSAPPASARYLFYNEAGTLLKEVTGVTGTVRETLPAGRYRLIVHNEDARQVDYRGTDTYATAEVFALTAPETRATGTPCILQPQTIYGTGACLEGEWLVVESGQTTRATVNPSTLTHQVQFRFVVNGTIEAHTLTGTINGVSPGIYLATGAPNRSESCSLSFVAATRQTRRSAKSAADEFAVNLNVFDLLAVKESPAGTTTIDVTLTDTGGIRYDVSVDLTATLQEMIQGNGGTIPVEVPLEVTFEEVAYGDITSSVHRWDNSGTGSGKPSWD